MKNIRQTIGKINIRGPVAFDEPMARHTSFEVGGPADVYVVPTDREDLRMVREYARDNDIPVFILGAGANILVSDRGIRGIVIDTSSFAGVEIQGDIVQAAAGVEMSEVCERALEASLSGLEFIYAMPGSVGGSVYMNARCYGTSISDVLSYVDVLDSNGNVARRSPPRSAFSYKHSPFMESDDVILHAGFQLEPGSARAIETEMHEHRDDRERKGHFLAPCAGSVFKNNRAFGSPTGKIIDELGLKGFRIGGARISPIHGNIIVNDRGATATELLELIQHVERIVQDKRGYALEREVIPIGQWK